MSSLTVQEWPTLRLVAYEKNPRKNDHVVEKMAKAIKEFGFKIPIVAKSDGTVVDGHLRLKAAISLGLETVPVALADDLSEAQIKAFRLLANKSAEWADWDESLLKIELSDLAAMDFDLDLTGFNEVELKEFFEDEKPKKEKIPSDDGFSIILEFTDEIDQKKIYDELCERGYKCRILS